MSKRTTQGLLKSLLKVNISLGSIPAMEKKVSKSLDPSFKTLQKRVDQTKVAYVDETSFRQEAKNCYVLGSDNRSRDSPSYFTDKRAQKPWVELARSLS